MVNVSPSGFVTHTHSNGGIQAYVKTPVVHCSCMDPSCKFWTSAKAIYNPTTKQVIVNSGTSRGVLVFFETPRGYLMCERENSLQEVHALEGGRIKRKMPDF